MSEANPGGMTGEHPRGMKRSAPYIVLALVGVIAAGIGGYWLGMQRPEAGQAATPAPAERRILHYRNPMGLPDTSPVPKKDNMGMDYIPVYADEVPPAQPERRILHYRNPMGLPDTSPVPKKDSMGMDYIPVYADDATAPGQVSLSPDKVQKLGVRTEPATLRALSKTVRAVGQFQLDERKQASVTTKFEGYIERLHVNATGQPVRRGQPLMEVYSPELVSAQEEYLIAAQGGERLSRGSAESRIGVRELADSALRRLRNWDISEAQLARLQREGKATRTLTVYSPVSGVVLEKTALQGMRVMPGEALFRIADLSSIWLVAEVYEQDLAQVRIGQEVEIRVDAYPERDIRGKVTYVYPTVNPETRTAQVRVELANPGGLLKPDMYANVTLAAPEEAEPVLAVPDSAVIDSGMRQVVLIERAPGLFEPRAVKLGRRGEGHVQVLEGVGEGERVVVRANFLIDAESNLKAALGSFGTSAQGAAPASENPAPAAPAGHEGH